ncbi:hypothetical protein IFM89_022282 [Coptis chinensis]|uniref:Protein kinase domain-containing protein n=1 Tax=Coptis chinensis TaxID=261450 RepID=A0A835IBX3_9MAGN|nr:hypothetical protein IFM89_022282 [Coptis chinensis]
MANDQNSIPKDLRPLNIITRPITDTSARNIDGFFPNPHNVINVSNNNSPGSRLAAPTVEGQLLGFPNATYPFRPGFNDGPSVGSRNAGEEVAAGEKKVKFLCSFGGKMLPRPSDGVLRYVGGNTRIISVRRNVSFPDLVRKMMDTYGQPVIIKYQLPGEDLDALVSVSCPEDLDNMMEEYGKLVESYSDGSGKLRVFLFSASELDSGGVVQFGDLNDSGQRYVDAVNGIMDGLSGTLTRRESTASATSTHNSDSLVSGGEGGDGSVYAHGDGGGITSPSMLSPRVVPAASLEATTRLVYVGPNPVMHSESPTVTQGHSAVVTAAPQSLSSVLTEQGPVHAVGQQQPLVYDFREPSGMGYVQTTVYTQGYVDPHQDAFGRVDYSQFSPQIGYFNPNQVYGMGAPMYRHVDHPQQMHDNAAGFPPHQFIPAMHMTMAPPTSHVNIRPNGAQQFSQLQQPWANSYPGINSFGTRIVQLSNDKIHNAHEPHPLSLHSPVDLQARGYEQTPVSSSEHVVCSEDYTSSQQKTVPEKAIRFDDCSMCQNALPHAHSDAVVQDQRDNSLMINVSNSNPVFHSMCSEDISKLRALKRVVISGAMGEGAVEYLGTTAQPTAVGQINQNVPSQVGMLGSGQSPKVQHDHENIFAQKRENFNQTRMYPPGGIALSNNTPLPYGLHFESSAQSGQDGALQQHMTPLHLQDPNMMNQPVRAGNYSKVMPSQTSEPQVHDSHIGHFGMHPGLAQREDAPVTCVLGDHRRPIEGRMEPFYTNTPEISGNNEQYRMQYIQLTKDEIQDIRPQMIGKETYVPSVFTKAGVPSVGNHIDPVETLPSSSEVVYVHDLHPAQSIQIAQPVTSNISGPYLCLSTVVPLVSSNEVWNGKPTFLGVDSAYATDRISLIGEQREEGSQFPSRVVSDESASVPQNGNSLSAIPPLSGKVEEDINTAPSDSLFSNQDPWTLRHGTHFPPPRPNKVPTSKEPYIMSDEGVIPQLPSNLKDFEQDRCVKDSSEEHIRQELQATAEGVAASVLQSSMPSDLPALELNEPIPEVTANTEFHSNSVEVQSTSEVENTKTRLVDKTIPGLPISNGIGCLQIIKNIDLEELRELGSGTFGTVYHGKWRGTAVAIKRINDRCFAGKPSEQDRMRDDFWNEAIKLADLHHPNVVAFYGVVLDGPGGSVATVTEYMVNGSLRQAIQRNDRTLDKRKRVLIAMDVAFGMEYLHGKNIVHFDLKSDNLLVNLRDPHRPICKELQLEACVPPPFPYSLMSASKAWWRPLCPSTVSIDHPDVRQVFCFVVGDLGLSKVKCQTLISGGVRGTLPWMAPELLNGSSNLVSEKVDVFSFGIVMWELLTGEEPYADLHYGAIIGGIVSNTLRPPVPDSCDPDWGCLMERCWSAEPSERPSFTDIANQLRAMAASLPSRGAQPTQTNAQK